MNELLLRRRVAASKSLPYDAEVEYLEGGTTQYIDTGVVPTVNMRAILSASGVTSQSGTVFGSRIALYSSMYALTAPANADLRFDFGNKIYNVNGYLTDRHSYGLFGDQLKGVIDDNRVANFSSTTISSQYTIHLFGFNNGGTHVYRTSDMKIHSLSLWNGDTRFMVLKPVRVGTTGYMYDSISGQLFGNAGTGSFILGSDINY